MRDLSALQRHHLVYAIRNFYIARGWGSSTASPDEKRIHDLTAAAFADDIVRRVLECDPEGGMNPVSLWKRKDGSMHTVTLAKAEEDAYGQLRYRAQIAPANPFKDTEARWFMANRRTERA